MVKSVEGFRVRDLFEALDELGGLPPGGRLIVGLVREHPIRDDVLQVARPGSSDEWHDLPQEAVAAFTPLRVAAGDVEAAGLVRFHLRSGEDHPIASDPPGAGRGAAGALDALSGTGAVGFLAAGPQYCYFDAEGRYVCVPI